MGGRTEVRTYVWTVDDVMALSIDVLTIFSSSMLRLMTSLCVSFVRMRNKPLFEDYCYVNEDRLYNTE